ncbi:mitochondrial glycine transporter [Holotrichia oblita]|uniref:Mitochondrial glycine transporter n=2 Tax=Holotrichia oblita TaxID=644536 RepID=A0ACB9SNW4_HOLOL|nr:mitochondrial glycine transporter [Holotrichia oblita]
MDIITHYPILKAFMAGSVSGTCSTLLFQPLDLVKTRLQNPAVVSGRSGAGMITIFSNIIQKEHITGLWRGMTPSRTIFNRNMFYFYRFESGVYGYNSVANALREIYRTEGVKGMTCGLLPTLFRDAPFSGLYLMFYTQTKLLVSDDLLNSAYRSPIHFTCGVTAGILASVVTQPADVLKTKMQLYPNKFNGIWSVVVYVHGKYGIRGYFKGIVPRMLRRTLMTAMAWTVYERITTNVGLK